MVTERKASLPLSDFPSELCRPITLEQPEHSLWPPNWVGHIPFAFWIVEAVKPKLFVELGVHTGVSYFSFCQAVKALGLPTDCFGIDSWEGDNQAGFFGPAVYEKICAEHALKFKEFSNLMRMTFDQAGNRFSDGSIDLLHMDGCHTYEAVRHDFETWLPKVSSGGVILFHDISVREKDYRGLGPLR